MKIQTLSVCVPGGCPNKCPFCVSRMRVDEYPDQIEHNHRFRSLYKKDFKCRLMFARDNGCNTAILTGQGEPLWNCRFLEDFLEWNDMLPSPFRWVELQTSGVGLDIEKRCQEIKRYDFNLRISLNMTKDVMGPARDADDLFNHVKSLGADQVTFRILYTSGDPELPQNKWIRENRASSELLETIQDIIRCQGRPLEQLPFGATRYSVRGTSTVVDSDCMATSEKEAIRYLVLRPNCKLYSKWDDEGSLVF